MATLGTNIINPSLRIAGITTLPGTLPSTDQSTELITAVNRLLGSWNAEGTKIFSQLIQTFSLTAGQKIYTIGPGAQLDTTPSMSPIFLTAADFIFPGTPQVRREITIMRTVQEWESIGVQDIAGAPCWFLYFDNGYDSNGYGKVYIAPQPPTGYTLELAYGNQLRTTFSATTDAFIMPPGYERALVYNLAVDAATLYPEFANIRPEAIEIAKKLAREITSMNLRSPALMNDASGLGGYGWDLPGFGWWLSGI
jgi:hypothetical protein